MSERDEGYGLRRGAALLRGQDVGLIDAAAAEAGLDGWTLMRRAGTAVAARAAALGQDAGPVVVLAGPGANGGDGYVAASILQRREIDHVVFGLGDPKHQDAVRARAAYEADGGVVSRLERDAVVAAAADAGVVVDALFGCGLDRALDGPAAAVLDALRAKPPARVLAVDVPSGVSADTGAALGPVLPADESVTFGGMRRGHRLGEGALLSGVVRVVDIFGAFDVEAPLRASGDAIARDLRLEHFAEMFDKPIAAHKYAHGHALAFSGGQGASGAARLSAVAALRAGAGLVTIAAPVSAIAECAAHLTSVMLAPVQAPSDADALLSDRRVSSVLIGPGFARGRGTHFDAHLTRAYVEAALGHGRATVLDADALTAYALHPEHLFRVARRNGRVVMTPHAGEFARLFPDLAERLEAGAAGFGKIEAALAAAERTGAVVVLKGFDTVLAAPDGRVGVHAAVGDRAAPWLATAGSGDVLAGVIAGRLASGNDPLEAACAAVCLHGALGVRGGPGLIAEDLPGMIPAVLRSALGDQAAL